MCSGFWIGLGWSLAFGVRGVAFLAWGFAGSCSSAVVVALWLLLGEATAALSLWRYLRSPAVWYDGPLDPGTGDAGADADAARRWR